MEPIEDQRLLLAKDITRERRLEKVRREEGLEPAQQGRSEQLRQGGIDATGADIRFGGNRAFYNQTGDLIRLPFRHQFTQGESSCFGILGVVTRQGKNDSYFNELRGLKR